MKILKHGFYAAKQLTCKLCGCVFEFEKEDLDRRGRLYCPECGQSDGLPIVNPLWVRWKEN